MHIDFVAAANLCQCCTHCSQPCCFKMSPTIDCVLNRYKTYTVCNNQSKSHSFVEQCALKCLPRGENVWDAWSLKIILTDSETPFRLEDTVWLCVHIRVVCVHLCVCGMGAFCRVQRVCCNSEWLCTQYRSMVQLLLNVCGYTSLEVPEVHVCAVCVCM